MSKGVYALIGDTYYRVNQDPSIPSEIDTCERVTPISYVDHTEANELEIKLNLKNFEKSTALSNRERADKMLAFLKLNTNITSIDIIQNRFVLNLAYRVYGDSNKLIDSGTMVRSIDPVDVGIILGVDHANNACYSRAKKFTGTYEFATRNQNPYGIINNRNRKYTFIIDDISIYMDGESEDYGTSSVLSPVLSKPLLIYSSSTEGVELPSTSLNHIPRTVTVNMKILLDGFIGIFDAEDINKILELNETIGPVYADCQKAFTVYNTLKMPEEDMASEPKPVNEIFKFTIEGKTGNEPLPPRKYAYVKDSGVGHFAAITYTKPGTYFYIVKMEKGNNEYINYSTMTYVVRVVVTSDKYILTPEVTIMDVMNRVYEKMSFKTSFDYEYTEYEVNISNIVSGSEPETRENFKFVMSPVTPNAPMPDTNTLLITGTDTASFGSIRYNTEGTYKYTIVQRPGIASNGTYDRSKYTLVIEIASNDEKKLVLNSTILKDGVEADSIEFTNIYNLIPRYGYIQFASVLNGAPKDAEPETFTFVLKPETDAAPMPENDRVTITANGTDKFGPILYDQIGSYNYTAYQLPGNDNHYNYCSDTYGIDVEVTEKNSVIYLETTYYISDTKCSEMIFENTYTDLQDNTALSITTHAKGNGGSVPDENGFYYIYEYCRETNPYALKVVTDDISADEFDDETMVPISCVVPDIAGVSVGETVIYTTYTTNYYA